MIIFVRDDLNMKSPLGFGIMKKAEILPNMTEVWLRNQTTEFLLGTDRQKFTLSVLVEAEISRSEGRGSENFSQKPKILGFSIDVSLMQVLLRDNRSTQKLGVLFQES